MFFEDKDEEYLVKFICCIVFILTTAFRQTLNKKLCQDLTQTQFTVE